MKLRDKQQKCHTISRTRGLNFINHRYNKNKRQKWNKTKYNSIIVIYVYAYLIKIIEPSWRRIFTAITLATSKQIEEIAVDDPLDWWYSILVNFALNIKKSHAARTYIYMLIDNIPSSLFLISVAKQFDLWYFKFQIPLSLSEYG